MTNPTPLSPAAQAVGTAFNEAPIYAEVKLAAALRAAADQVNLVRAALVRWGNNTNRSS